MGLVLKTLFVKADKGLGQGKQADVYGELNKEFPFLSKDEIKEGLMGGCRLWNTIHYIQRLIKD